MRFFLPRHHFEKTSIRLKKAWSLFLKSLALLLAPLPFSFLLCLFWYYVIFKREYHFNEKMEVIVTAAWIPMFGILYCLLAATVLATVWNEYKSIRKAVKEYDFETFINLRDEEMSPLVYILVGVVSTFVLASFMSLKYPRWEDGAIVIGSTAYVLCLLFLVVKEIDDPCSGIWFIKNIPPEWLEINSKEWRKTIAQKKQREMFKECLGRMNSQNGKVTTTELQTEPCRK